MVPGLLARPVFFSHIAGWKSILYGRASALVAPAETIEQEAGNANRGGHRGPSVAGLATRAHHLHGVLNGPQLGKSLAIWRRRQGAAREVPARRQGDLDTGVRAWARGGGKGTNLFCHSLLTRRTVSRSGRRTSTRHPLCRHSMFLGGSRDCCSISRRREQGLDDLRQPHLGRADLFIVSWFHQRQSGIVHQGPHPFQWVDCQFRRDARGLAGLGNSRCIHRARQSPARAISITCVCPFVHPPRVIGRRSTPMTDLEVPASPGAAFPPAARSSVIRERIVAPFFPHHCDSQKDGRNLPINRCGNEGDGLRIIAAADDDP